MKNDNIQLQKGLSLSQFIATYGTEQQCEAVLEKSCLPECFRCARCGSKRHARCRRSNVLMFQSSDCRKQVSLTERTIFY